MTEKITLSEFNDVFKIMDNSFPNTEMRTYEEQKNLINNDIYSIIVKKNNNNKIIGFICYWNITEFIYIEHFAIDEKERGNNIGGNMIKDFCKNQKKIIILEVEHPINNNSIRRIEFYKRNGFFLNDYEYLQPPLREGNDFLPLKIMSSKRTINNNEFIKLKNDLYTKVYKYKE